MYSFVSYTEDDKMSDLICGHYPMLLVLSRFGIPLGFGEKTINKVCSDNNVHTGTFLTVVNLLLNPSKNISEERLRELSLNSLLDYLHNSHSYFLDYRLPAIRAKLLEAINYGNSDVSIVIMRYFDVYVAEVRKHMQYEEDTVFTYVKKLTEGKNTGGYGIAVFREQHNQVEARLTELKNIIIKYYPDGGENELNSVLFDIFSCERDLASHNDIENYLLVPAIMRIENKGS
ncbi:MAG: hemerythrin domain-containing protein [Rikenellaceae bacterium]|nr:hemerythrin domain-containing protein [Rikenellaceae bacterium]